MKSKKPTIPTNNVPENAVWFGGPIEWLDITLRIYGDDLNPIEITQLLGINATTMGKKNEQIVENNEISRRIARTGEWCLSYTREATDEWDVNNAIEELMNKVNKSKSIWEYISKKYRVDLFVILLMHEINKGFGLEVELMNLLSDLGIEIGFDIYYEENRLTPASTCHLFWHESCLGGHCSRSSLFNATFVPTLP